MMQRTMVLTQRQVRMWQIRQGGVLQREFRYFRCGDRGFCPPLLGLIVGRKHRLSAVFVCPRGKRVAAAPDV
ncbi:hypothetical protein [Rhizobium leguminosarum]|uniref:hypothetical protein n=1 Tax=Rhizobium leguminosarum TaxID=384 RepID=UPI0011D0CEF5|nr:hypothetical protein [Rhizobium leguminosarum]